MAEFKTPRKRFGQNFLQDQNIINKIVQAIDPQPDDQLVEVGPGRGALTFPILETVKHLDIIEIDRDLVEWWHSKQLDKITIHAQDALKFDLCTLVQNNKLRVIGNLPYNISTPLLFHLFEHLECISDMHFMLQKEVVDRMVAKPGSKTYGRLSVMTQFFCQAQRLFTVSPHAFQPPPKVESAIVRLVPREQSLDINKDRLAELVQQAFSQRRKTLRNSLKGWFTSEQMSVLGIDPAARPETLDLEAFTRLTRAADKK